MRRRTALGATAVGAILALRPGAPARVLADDRPPRRVGLHRLGGWLAVSVGLQDLFVPGDSEKLRSGFATRVLVRIDLWPEGAQAPAARTFRRSDVVYDVWDERFRVALVDVRGVSTAGEEPTLRAAIERATTLVRYPVADLARLGRGGRYYLVFRADLNPLSEDLVADLRRWLVGAPGAGRGAGDSVFGSFVSVFVNPRIEQSERFIRFRSQVFELAPEVRR
jgi:hypothetical protein